MNTLTGSTGKQKHDSLLNSDVLMYARWTLTPNFFSYKGWPSYLQAGVYWQQGKQSSCICWCLNVRPEQGIVVTWPTTPGALSKKNSSQQTDLFLSLIELIRQTNMHIYSLFKRCSGMWGMVCGRQALAKFKWGSQRPRAKVLWQSSETGILWVGLWPRENILVWLISGECFTEEGSRMDRPRVTEAGLSCVKMFYWCYLFIYSFIKKKIFSEDFHYFWMCLCVWQL